MVEATDDAGEATAKAEDLGGVVACVVDWSAREKDMLELKLEEVWSALG